MNKVQKSIKQIAQSCVDENYTNVKELYKELVFDYLEIKDKNELLNLSMLQKYRLFNLNENIFKVIDRIYPGKALNLLLNLQ